MYLCVIDNSNVLFYFICSTIIRTMTLIITPYGVGVKRILGGDGQTIRGSGVLVVVLACRFVLELQ